MMDTPPFTTFMLHDLWILSMVTKVFSFWLEPGHSAFTSKRSDLSPNDVCRAHQKAVIQNYIRCHFPKSPTLDRWHLYTRIKQRL